MLKPNDTWQTPPNFSQNTSHYTGEMAGYKSVNLVWTHRDFCLRLQDQTPEITGFWVDISKENGAWGKSTKAAGLIA